MLLMFSAVCFAYEKDSNQQILEDVKIESKRGQACGGHSCCGGVPGIPGTPGRAGAVGRDGRDGTPGRDGSLGPKGQQGSDGPRGPKGDPGPQGPRGPQGLPSSVSHANWKECSWKNLNNGIDHGLVVECLFEKKYRETALHVYWNGALRVYNCNACCKRWFFTFNGAECLSPRAIDGVVYMWKGQGIQDPHRVRHIEGHCLGVHKGRVRVGFNIGNCPSYGNSDGYTGWNSNSRIFIEEVPPPQK